MTRWADEEQISETLGAEFRRTPGRWAGNRVMHALIDAGWSIWTVVDQVRKDIEHYQAHWEHPEEPFSAPSYALGYFNACIAVGRANRGQQTNPR